MDAKTIRKKMKEHGVKVADIAKSLNVSHVSVITTIKGFTTSARISQAVADAINVPVEQLRNKEVPQV